MIERPDRVMYTREPFLNGLCDVRKNNFRSGKLAWFDGKTCKSDCGANARKAENE